MNSNMLMNSFLLSSDEWLWKNKISYSKSANDLQNLCRNIVNDTLNWKISLTTWIWLGDIWVPIRLPSLIIPWLRVIRNLKKIWVEDIKYVIYQAKSFIINENSLNKKNAQINSQIILNYLNWFISEYYPDLLENIIYDFDFNLDIEHIWIIANNIKFLKWNKDVELTMWKLVNYALSKWKTEDSAFIYWAANILCNWHINEYYPINNNHEIIIPIWWKKERPFFNLWKVYEEENFSNSQKKIIIPLIQKTWEIPTYYPNKWEDYFDYNYEYKPLTWEKLNSSLQFDREQVLLNLWKWFNFNSLIKNIIW